MKFLHKIIKSKYSEKLNAPFYCPKIMYMEYLLDKNRKKVFEKKNYILKKSKFIEKIFHTFYINHVSKKTLDKYEFASKNVGFIKTCSNCEKIICYKLHNNKNIISVAKRNHGYFNHTFIVNKEEEIKQNEINEEELKNKLKNIKNNIEENIRRNEQAKSFYI